MIFDTDRYQRIASKYKSRRRYELPQILLLKDFSREVELLESLVEEVAKEKREPLLARLISDNDSNHIGAWFELRLFGWLQKIGETEFQPTIHGATPDASVSINGGKIAIEAKVIVDSKDTVAEDKFYGQLLFLLRKLRMPYGISVENVTLKHIQDEEHFLNAVAKWLEGNPSIALDYGDDVLGHIVLKAKYLESLENPEVMGPAKFSYINPDLLKPHIKQKAGQHSAIRHSETPYVIALLVERRLFSAEEVVAAWFGKQQIELSISDYETQITGATVDQTGLHYWGKDFLHTSVAGTLVFKRTFKDDSIDLEAWWIENPNAHKTIRSDVFPVSSKWVVLRRDSRNAEMGWVRS